MLLFVLLFDGTDLAVSFHVDLVNLSHVFRQRRFAHALHEVLATNQGFFHRIVPEFAPFEKHHFITFDETAEGRVAGDQPADEAVEQDDHKAASHYRYEIRCADDGTAHDGAQRNADDIIQRGMQPKGTAAGNADEDQGDNEDDDPAVAHL